MKRSSQLAGRAMLVWLAVYLVGAFCLPTAAGLFSALGCLIAALFVGRDAPLCGAPAAKPRYSKAEYASALGLLISGSALLSFAVALLLRLCGAGQTGAGQSGFFRALILSCAVPAFFEELLLRGRVLGLLRPSRGNGVWLCGALFALMHGSFVRLPYAFFAGVLLSALVYLTDNLWIGMLFHFCNNFASLLLSCLPDAAAFGAAALLAALFFICVAALRRKPLFADAKALLCAPRAGALVRSLDLSVWLYTMAALALCVLQLL